MLINYKNPPNPNILSGLIEYFNNWSIIFGQQFVNYVMKPAIEAELSKIEQNLIKQEYRNQFSPALISVYLGFLNAENEDEEHVKNIIKR